MPVRRNTPLQTRQARQGYRPLPGTVTTSHPALQKTPTKTHTVASGA